MFLPAAALATNPFRYLKLAFIVAIIIAFGAMALYIKIQAVDLQSAQNMLAYSEETNKTLNQRIHDQNLKIKTADEKFKNVQNALDKNKKTNKALQQEFAKLKGDLATRPVPQTCETIREELITTSKEVVKKWKR